MALVGTLGSHLNFGASPHVSCPTAPPAKAIKKPHTRTRRIACMARDVRLITTSTSANGTSSCGEVLAASELLWL